jgi:hypothetical protein
MLTYADVCCIHAGLAKCEEDLLQLKCVWDLVSLVRFTQFTCFTSAKVQILTPDELVRVGARVGGEV